MIELYNDKTGDLIGEISAKQLQFLIDYLEEESRQDKDYAITALTLDYFVSLGIDQELLSLLRQALGDKEEVIIRWDKRPG